MCMIRLISTLTRIYIIERELKINLTIPAPNHIIEKNHLKIMFTSYDYHALIFSKTMT